MNRILIILFLTSLFACTFKIKKGDSLNKNEKSQSLTECLDSIAIEYETEYSLQENGDSLFIFLDSSKVMERMNFNNYVHLNNILSILGEKTTTLDEKLVFVVYEPTKISTYSSPKMEKYLENQRPVINELLKALANKNKKEIVKLCTPRAAKMIINNSKKLLGMSTYVRLGHLFDREDDTKLRYFYLLINDKYNKRCSFIINEDLKIDRFEFKW